MAFTTIGLILLFAVSAFAQEAVIRDADAKSRLLGAHALRLQWIDSGKKDLGRILFEESNRVIRIRGEQRSPKGGLVAIDGTVTVIDRTEFTMTGRIVTQVDRINSGRACERTGMFTFRLAGGHSFYRLQEMQNPCGDAVDHVDIYVAQAKD